MTGQATWISLISLFVAVAVVGYFWLRARRDARPYTRSTRTVRCRDRQNQLARVEVSCDARTGEPVGILECSLQPGIVRCNRACLALLKATPVPTVASHFSAPFGL